jgi:membrane protease subunit (stomatin/prohibitin family)
VSDLAILDVVKFEGLVDKRWLVYRHPGNEFNNKSKLIVGPGQIGMLVHGGKVSAILESGTYTMDTENFPFIRELVKGVYSGNVPYMMEVYFVNKTMKLDMLWGTKDPIQLLDPKFKVKINVRARGQYALRIKNYQFLVTQLVGSLGGKSVIDFEVISDFFRALINTKVKTLLAQYFIKNQVSILDMSMYLDEVSMASFESIRPEFEKFGFEVVNFYYESINIPNEDLEIINSILNKNAEFNILGEDRYRTSRGYDVLEAAAKNEGTAGGIVGAGVGLGVGLGVGQQAAGMASNIIPPKSESSKDTYCIKCHAKIESDDKFCPECGEKQNMKCSSCGSTLEFNSKFCPECGTPVKRGKL